MGVQSPSTLPTHANAPVSKGPPCERIISQAVSDYMLDIFLRRDNLKISIIGLGSVGKAAELGLAEFHEVSGYDIDGRGNWQDVLSSELTFVCVNTDASEDSTLDMSNVIAVCSKLSEDEYCGLVVVKSTLHPGTMDKINSKHPSLRLAYMPEFLREKDAVEWFAEPDRIVISGGQEDMEITLSCFDWVPDSIPRLRMNHLEAELGKLAHNAYIATKVTFTCEIERIAKEFGVDPYPVMESVWTDRRVRNSAHLTPGLGGFDGKCVPKDTAALSSVDSDPNSILKILEERGSKEAVELRNLNQMTDE